MKHFIMLTIALALCFFMAATQAQNKLSKKETKAGWKLLFDGTSTTGWRNFNSNTIGDAWKVKDGVLFLDNTVKVREERGDIVTHEEYENFELELEWKIDSCGNSGLMFNVVEDPKYRTPWVTGPEMQILDNSCHPDAKIEKHRAGDLYDLIKSSKETVKPAGQWNKVRIVSKNAHYEFWLNGTKNVEFTMHTPEWDGLVQNSKFKSMADFGKAKKGHLSLQDHGDKVSFRNIKIKVLK